MSGKVGRGAKGLLLQMHGRKDLPPAAVIQVKNHSRAVCFRHLWKCCKLWNKLKACLEVKIAGVITVIDLQVRQALEV